MRRLFRFLSRRLAEPSTWAALTASIVAASAMPDPWCYVLAALAVPGALLAEQGTKVG